MQFFWKVDLNLIEIICDIVSKTANILQYSPKQFHCCAAYVSTHHTDIISLLHRTKCERAD
jgi:hypothetical protein